MVVATGDALIAPLSGRPCVFYETRVIRAVGCGIDPWDIEYQAAFEKRSQPFFVDGGTALIDQSRAEMLLGTDVDRWSFDNDVDPAIFVSDQEEDVEVTFDAEIAWRIEERTYHPSEVKDRMPDGRLRYRIRSSAQWEIIP